MWSLTLLFQTGLQLLQVSDWLAAPKVPFALRSFYYCLWLWTMHWLNNDSTGLAVRTLGLERALHCTCAILNFVLFRIVCISQNTPVSATTVNAELVNWDALPVPISDSGPGPGEDNVIGHHCGNKTHLQPHPWLLPVKILMCLKECHDLWVCAGSSPYIGR